MPLSKKNLTILFAAVAYFASTIPYVTATSESAQRRKRMGSKPVTTRRRARHGKGTKAATSAPTRDPTNAPTQNPSTLPSSPPSVPPSSPPTTLPTNIPTLLPTPGPSTPTPTRFETPTPSPAPPDEPCTSTNIERNVCINSTEWDEGEDSLKSLITQWWKNETASILSLEFEIDESYVTSSLDFSNSEFTSGKL